MKEGTRKIKEINKIAILSLILVLTISCSDNRKINDNNSLSRVFVGNNLKYQIFFPDTVILNKKYSGEIRYSSSLDTITKSFDDKTKVRYITFRMLTTKNIDYDEHFLNKITKDTFGAINNKTIPFYDIAFKSTGAHYIDGIINDYVIIDTFKNDKARYIEKEVRVTHKVIVINE